MNVPGTKPAYIVKELEPCKDKIVFTKEDGKEKKVRQLRQFEVIFPRGHSVILNELGMEEQELLMIAPAFHEASNEIVPGSANYEHFVGLARDEYVKSTTPLPNFK